LGGCAVSHIPGRVITGYITQITHVVEGGSTEIEFEAIGPATPSVQFNVEVAKTLVAVSVGETTDGRVGAANGVGGVNVKLRLEPSAELCRFVT
jgi:hypothetical protein